MEHIACEHPYRINRKFELCLHVPSIIFLHGGKVTYLKTSHPFGDAVGVKGFMYWLAVQPNKLTLWNI
jgi:hypothetical protein